MTPSELAARGKATLDRIWTDLENVDLEKNAAGDLDQVIDDVLGGKEVGYKKALIIQLAGKAADFSVDAQAMQRGDGSVGAWDAREFAKRVFVPWNASIGFPLGSADDPYVSNQFRNPRFDNSIRAKRKNGALFDKVLAILEAANAATSEVEVERLLQAVLFGVRRMIQGQSFDYPAPSRASLDGCIACIDRYLALASGGARLQAVVQALFLSCAAAGFAMTDIFARHVNASDSSSKAPGDIAFVKGSRRVAVEVKDRLLTEPQLTVSVAKARIAGVTELIFLVHGHHSESVFVSANDQAAAQSIANKEFSSGLNIYWASFRELLRMLLILLGEDGRRDFLKFIGQSLEEQNVDAKHRWAWAKLVSEV